MKRLKFGGKLEVCRRKEGVTIGALARMSGVPERTVERLLAGQNEPTAAHFVRLARALDINMDLFDPEDFETEGMP